SYGRKENHSNENMSDHFRSPDKCRFMWRNSWRSPKATAPATSYIRWTEGAHLRLEEDISSAANMEHGLLTESEVRAIFQGLERGDGARFLENVDDKVEWTVEGTHPLAGHDTSKSDFVAGTFAKLGKVLPYGTQPVVEHVLVKDDQAVVELHSLATAKDGLR